MGVLPTGTPRLGSFTIPVMPEVLRAYSKLSCVTETVVACSPNRLVGTIANPSPRPPMLEGREFVPTGRRAPEAVRERWVPGNTFTQGRL